jgi:hypothetical protein
MPDKLLTREQVKQLGAVYNSNATQRLAAATIEALAADLKLALSALGRDSGIVRMEARDMIRTRYRGTGWLEDSDGR